MAQYQPTARRIEDQYRYIYAYCTSYEKALAKLETLLACGEVSLAERPYIEKNTRLGCYTITLLER